MFSLAIVHFFSPQGGRSRVWLKLRILCPAGLVPRGWEATSLASLARHQEPLTPYDTTEQVKSCSHTFPLRPQSSHLALHVSSSFFNRPLAFRLGYGLTALKLKRISSIKSPFLSICLSHDPSQSGRHCSSAHPYRAKSVSTYGGSINSPFEITHLASY